MQLVLITALGVGGATIFGSIIGFAFKGMTHKFSDMILSFAAGVMLAAAVLGLILPSLDYGGKWGLLVTIAGIFINSPLWIVYNIIVGSWAGILDEIVTEASMLLSIYRYGWKNLDTVED